MKYFIKTVKLSLKSVLLSEHLVNFMVAVLTAFYFMGTKTFFPQPYSFLTFYQTTSKNIILKKSANPNPMLGKKTFIVDVILKLDAVQRNISFKIVKLVSTLIPSNNSLGSVFSEMQIVHFLGFYFHPANVKR